MSDLEKLRKDLRKFERSEKKRALQKFFKTGFGEYAEGDKFLGLKTEETRNIARKNPDLGFSDLEKLLASKIHEERIVAVMILKQRFEKADIKKKRAIYHFYLENLSGINNWDLVDGSAPEIVGGYFSLSKSPRHILYQFSKSNNLWKRRIAIMVTYKFIKEKDYKDALKISEILLQDKHDLIHKAVGWMLREIGNRDLSAEEKFLKKYYKKMPRIMLRYAIEKFPERQRKAYLKGEID